jgi:crotonobetainyl-CoA:carnitine CoA-transferase CaiB-like acyl-CoA transferase
MELLDEMWRALGGDPAAPATLELHRPGPVLASPLAVEELLTGAAGCTLLAAAELAEARTGRRPAAALDVDGLAVAAASQRHLRVDGEPPGDAFAPLSSFLRAADGWIRTHANYPWHRDALLRALGTGEDEAAVRAAVASRPAAAVERAVVDAGGAAAAVRPPGAWRTGAPLTAREPGPDTGARLPGAGRGALPAAGARVLDLTRVIAGPVGTRMLAALGADVARVQDPRRPELPLLVLDGGLGKRWLELDLRVPAGHEALELELAAADVVVLGHRPGALDRFGLAPDALAARHPRAVVVTLSAWGGTGPSGALRGFDSLVQAATGIAEAVRPGDETAPPGALPVQALDHATGYLVAAAALRDLAVREREGRAGRTRLALAATAQAMLRAGPRPPAAKRAIDPAAHLIPVGGAVVARPPGRLDGHPLRWPEPID